MIPSIDRPTTHLAPADRAAIAPVSRYFNERYPGRRRGGIARWFRAGEAERRAAVGPWLAGAAGATVLDVGTGDGFFLASVLAERPAALWLIDLSPAALAAATRRMAERATALHTAVGDVHALDLPAADIVVALGVTDYCRDWPALLGRLCRLARRSLIIDFPRAHTAHAAARRVWLWRHRVPLHTAGLAEVRAVTRGLGALEMAATRLHWVARLTVRREDA